MARLRWESLGFGWKIHEARGLTPERRGLSQDWVGPDNTEGSLRDQTWIEKDEASTSRGSVRGGAWDLPKGRGLALRKAGPTREWTGLDYGMGRAYRALRGKNPSAVKGRTWRWS